MDEEPATGREVSILAHLVQYPNLSKRDREKMLAQLSGRSLLVARALVGIDQRPSKKTREIIDVLREWASQTKRPKNEFIIHIHI